MRIGITCYPGVGGSGILATELGIYLAKKGHEIHFVTSSPPVRLSREYYDNIFFHEAEIIDYPVFKYPPYSLCLAAKMAEVIRNHKLDILHVHYAVPHAASAYLASQMCKDLDLKFITTLHGTDITLVGSQPGFIPFTKFSIEVSDGITAVSEHLKEVTYKIFNVEKDIEVIYNFVDTERFKPLVFPERRRRYAPDDHKILIHISNFRPVKKVLNTIRVFAKILEKVPSVLLMAGDGTQWCEANRLALELGISDNVKFLGKINMVEHLLPLADLFIINSIKESFGLAVLEAASCGVPALVTNIGGLPEVVDDGVTGIIAPPDDVETMADMGIKLLKDENLLNKMKKASRERAVKEFDGEDIVALYEDYYKKILCS